MSLTSLYLFIFFIGAMFGSSFILKNLHMELATLAIICFLGFWGFFLNFYFIHMCTQCLGYFSPLPPSPTPSLSLPICPSPSLTPPYPSIPNRNYSALISNFVVERV
jgi:hypothetical protein